MWTEAAKSSSEYLVLVFCVKEVLYFESEETLPTIFFFLLPPSSHRHSESLFQVFILALASSTFFLKRGTFILLLKILRSCPALGFFPSMR